MYSALRNALFRSDAATAVQNRHPMGLAIREANSGACPQLLPATATQQTYVGRWRHGRPYHCHGQDSMKQIAADGSQNCKCCYHFWNAAGSKAPGVPFASTPSPLRCSNVGERRLAICTNSTVCARQRYSTGLRRTVGHSPTAFVGQLCRRVVLQAA
jgi:hypothetical protein